ncbi:VWA domain-containing protein [Pendulispora brunnea]|uniref:VWA domain-containing protein n=1 Tax=Pendulispora brunnea TaxID=2905690 RepID=A0ABZ2JW94_9BACT
MTSTPPSVAASHHSGGGYLAPPGGAALPLRGIRLEADARGGLARVTLEQRFGNPHTESLSVTYSLPLPFDAAVSAFSFRMGDRRIVGEIEGRSAALERFEGAVLDGKTAARIDEERSNLFTQHIANIPPGTEIVAEVTIDQRLVWNEEGAWEWRFPLTVAPRYLGDEGRLADSSAVTQVVTESPQSTGASLSLRIRDAFEEAKLESPSHPIRMANAPGDGVLVSLLDDTRAALDRDLVVRWIVTTPDVGCTLDVGWAAVRHTKIQSAFGLLTLVPPHPTSVRQISRDLIVLFDTSGSMAGMPLEQAKRVIIALVQTLTEGDRLEMIAFSDVPRRWQEGAVSMSADGRRNAVQWLSLLRASGGTEMYEGIHEALRPIRHESQRQVVLVTDGLICFESEIVHEIMASLPSGARVHTVGVGSAVNRSLTASAARAGRGAEIIIGFDEDPEGAAQRLIARTDAPVVVDVEIAGSALGQCAPEKVPDLFAKSPVRVGLRLSTAGGTLVVRGRTATGIWEKSIEVPAVAHYPENRALLALFGRELVEDLEMRAAATLGDATSMNEAIERAGLEFGIATRLTSWVVISEEKNVDPRARMRRERIPQQVPYGMSVGVRSSLAFGASSRPGKTIPLCDTGPRNLRGTLVARLPNMLAIDVTVEGAPLDWQPPTEVLLLFPPGINELVSTGCHLQFTTTPGLVKPGISFRLAVFFSASETRVPRQILFRVNEQDITVML